MLFRFVNFINYTKGSHWIICSLRRNAAYLLYSLPSDKTLLPGKLIGAELATGFFQPLQLLHKLSGSELQLHKESSSNLSESSKLKRPPSSQSRIAPSSSPPPPPPERSPDAATFKTKTGFQLSSLCIPFLQAQNQGSLSVVFVNKTISHTTKVKHSQSPKKRHTSKDHF